jgi:hypothetical protein
MNNYYLIDEAITRLNRDCNWSHAFIRECYLVSSHCLVAYTEDDGEGLVGDADGPLNARLVIAFPGDINNTGVEFVFKSITAFSLQKIEPLEFSYIGHLRTGHLLRFGSDGECFMEARSVWVRFLDRSYLGAHQIAGFELPTDKWYVARKLDDCWRQCENCGSAWEECPRIEFSRCTGCGEMTCLEPVS